MPPPTGSPLRVCTVPESHTHLDLQETEVGDRRRRAPPRSAWDVIVQIGIERAVLAWAARVDADPKRLRQWPCTRTRPRGWSALRSRSRSGRIRQLGAGLCDARHRGTGFDHFRQRLRDGWAIQENRSSTLEYRENGPVSRWLSDRMRTRLAAAF